VCDGRDFQVRIESRLGELDGEINHKLSNKDYLDKNKVMLKN